MNSLMLGKTLDNRYELVEFIGKGGMALVYRAIDHRTGHSVEKSPDKAVPSTEPAILWRNVQQDFSVALLFLDRLVSGKELVLNFQINKSKLLLFFLLMLKIANREFVK